MEHLATIKSELAKVNVNEQVIAQVTSDFMPLVISGKTDKVGFERVHKARIQVRDMRLAIEEKRKELKADSLAYGRAVDSEAKRLTDMLAPVEAHLQGEEERIKAEKEAEEKAKQKLIDDMVTRRTQLIVNTGAQFNGVEWKLEELRITNKEILELVEDEFARRLESFTVVGKVIAEKKEKEAAEQARIAEEQRKKQEELEARERAVKEEEARIAREAREKQIKDEAAEAERKRIEAETKRKEEERLAAEAEAKRQRELAPEKQKLLAYIDSIVAIDVPTFKNGTKALQLYEELVNTILDVKARAQKLK